MGCRFLITFATRYTVSAAGAEGIFRVLVNTVIPLDRISSESRPGFEAVTTSAGMVSRVAGKGSAYLGSYYDADGNALMGSNNYSLHMEPNPPAANFWSITVYDIANRLIIQNDTKRADLSSRSEDLVTNSDGSVDLYFGPESPKGKENNWIQTNKGESLFVYLRLYGPEQAYFDQTFPMNKIEKIK